MRTLVLLLLPSLAILASDELFDAARKGDVAAVKATLDKGVPVDAKWRYDQTALLMAASRGHVEVVRLLLERGANPNVKDSFYGMTPLTAAAGKANPELINLLLDKGAGGADELLMISAGQGQTAVVRALLARPGWKPETLSKALASAESQKRTEVVEALKAAGAQPPKTVVVDGAILAGYAGSYRNDAAELTVTVTDGRLRIGPQGQAAMEYAALDANSFEPVQYPGMVKVVFDGKGGMQIQQRGAPQPMKFQRVEEKK